MDVGPPPKKKSKSNRSGRPLGKSRIAMHETYKAVVASWPKDMKRLLSSSLDAERRAELWELMAEAGDRLRREYAWALPDERALRVLEAYSPVLEVGAGRGYWASLLKARGVDVVAVDAKPPPKTFCAVDVGGPEDCSKHPDRTLFLCYPDDDCRADLDDDDSRSKSSRGSSLKSDKASEKARAHDDDDDNDDDDDDASSLALACLRAYEGDCIVVVGESICSGGTLSLAQAPWGRSCDSLFQVELAAAFHPVLVAALPRWPLSRDCITVWLRTRVCPIVFERDGSGDDDDSDDGPQGWADVPAAEQLDPDCAAPCARHLLAKPPSFP